MTPFQQLRIWLRQASPAGRRTTALSMAIAVTLVGWLVVPVSRWPASGRIQPFGGSGGAGATDRASSVAGSHAGDAGTTNSTRPLGASSGSSSGGGEGSSGRGRASGEGGPTVTGGGGTAGNAIVSQPGSAGRCPAAASGQGVSADKIDIAVTIINIVGAEGNGAVGVPSPAEQQSDWQYVADAINGVGGAACRHLALHFYSVNPVDSTNAQQQCLQIAADNPFIVLDTGALADVGASDCIPAQKIPLVSTFLTRAQLTKYYPYYLYPAGIAEDIFHNGYLGAVQKGYFGVANGFKKLGIVYQSCRPALVATGRAAIKTAGIPDNEIVAYDMGCPPNRTNSPADTQQAVLAFKNAAVTHVTELDNNDFNSFTKTAAQQNFKPHYVLADENLPRTVTGPLAPDATNLDGALDLVGGRAGENNTPGFTPNAATQRCDAIFSKHGQPPVYRQPASYGGVACFFLDFTTALLTQASQLQRSTLAPTMRSIGSFDDSFPTGPVDFAAVPTGAPYGEEFWRVVQYHASCNCWQVLDRTFHPPFP